MKTMHPRHALLLFCTLLIACLGFPHTAKAQDTEPLYSVVTYMKAHDEIAYEKMEREIFLPIHQEHVNDGNMVNWAFYWVQLGDRAEHDYVVISLYRGLERAINGGGGTGFEEYMKRAHPDMEMSQVLATLSTRTMVRTELWMQDPEANIPSQPFTTLEVDYMYAGPEHSGDYLAVEREIWKPIHEEFIKQGAEAGWSLWQLVFPHGTAQPYNYATANPHSGWKPASYADAAQAAHPNMSWEDIGEKTSASRDLVRGEVWVLLASTTAPPQEGGQ